MVPFAQGAQLIDAGVDWLTITAKDDGPCQELIEAGERLLGIAQDSGSVIKPGKELGFRGYGASWCYVGTKMGLVYLRVSGSAAHHHAPAVFMDGVKVTRIDLQATCKMPDIDGKYAHELVSRWRADRNGSARRNQCASKLIDSGSDGNSAYLGKRTSAFFGRVYDKARENPGEYPLGTWRIEAESKRRLATPIAQTLAAAGWRRETVIGLLKSQFRKRGVDIMLPSSLDVPEPIVPRRESDVDKKLAWLRNTVAPVLVKLHEMGYDAEAAEALYGWLTEPLGERG